MNPEQFSLPLTLLMFCGGTLVIALLGTRLTRIADRLADITGLGEAVFGAVLLGAATSLPGSVATITTALAGRADLAVGNAVGGIAAQTAFLVIADKVYRPANLEHAAASVANLINGALLCALLALPLLAATGPAVSLWGVHPASVLILVIYLFGLRLASATNAAPGWQPVVTAQTREDAPQEAQAGVREAWRAWRWFLVLVAIIGVAGWAVGASGIGLVRHTGLSQTVVGSLFTAVATSLPELVTAVAAVRQGALTLAVGGIIGGNTFDVLFLVFADLAYRDGSIYHAVSDQPLFIISLTILLTAFLLLGLVRRERRGIANIGFESVAVLVFYLAGVVTLVSW
ncbi:MULTISPECIES: sodium:calcium antiporter [Thiorhodovibrio]|uniref:sodium:calcium antiporter n=1 Tax=Thiorhodovibrio TaxID=61593 RepID=UPI001912369A|nr:MULTISPECIES: sodium:calcium antiporter [Thiorhodovibrio]MBK5969121.1 cation transporter [Thiorhodovibrio winogradskyi]WPL13406.1 Inner membrane protein YrbG [Thiorhodovibrio litoralis]